MYKGHWASLLGKSLLRNESQDFYSIKRVKDLLAAKTPIAIPYNFLYVVSRCSSFIFVCWQSIHWKRQDQHILSYTHSSPTSTVFPVKVPISLSGHQLFDFGNIFYRNCLHHFDFIVQSLWGCIDNTDGKKYGPASVKVQMEMRRQETFGVSSRRWVYREEESSRWI